MKTPSEILRKTKRSLDDEHDTEKKSYKKSDDDKDDKKVKRNGLLDFIAKHKKSNK
jgi:hypothetical protein